MKLLNIGCGSCRPPAPWFNLDNLHDQLEPRTPERINLDKETNYVNWDLNKEGMLPFGSDTLDGILCSHVIEHFDAIDSVMLLNECGRILRPATGILVVSVPDAEYFLSVHDRDTPENAVELFGEPICPAEPWHKSFFNYALFYDQHKQVLTRASLKCLLIRSGFAMNNIFDWKYGQDTDASREILKIMNRRKFSAELSAVK